LQGLRNEFSAYARTSISKWLLHCYRGYGSNWDYYGVLFQKEKMVLNRVVIIERIICRNYAVRKNRIPYEEYKKDKSPSLKRTVMQL
jgi:hypothetical protein